MISKSGPAPDGTDPDWRSGSYYRIIPRYSGSCRFLIPELGSRNYASTSVHLSMSIHHRPVRAAVGVSLDRQRHSNGAWRGVYDLLATFQSRAHTGCGPQRVDDCDGACHITAVTQFVLCDQQLHFLI